VEFSDAVGWSKPGEQTVLINPDTTTTTSGTYRSQIGGLRVMIGPPDAQTAGAQWQVDGGAWHASGEESSGLPVGPHTVSFKSIFGWTSPVDQVVTVASSETAMVSATYQRQLGALRVTLGPQAARTAGAQWRVDGGEWHNSDETVANLGVGPHLVSFKTVSGWTTPADQTVTVMTGEAAAATGAYKQAAPPTGSLQVAIDPERARNAGAQWRVAGGAWRNSDETVSALAAGDYTVEFKPISQWVAPPDQTVTITENQLTATSGAYTGGGLFNCYGGPQHDAPAPADMLLLVGAAAILAFARKTAAQRRLRSLGNRSGPVDGRHQRDLIACGKPMADR
jgi:hypothetical protein